MFWILFGSTVGGVVGALYQRYVRKREEMMAKPVNARVALEDDVEDEGEEGWPGVGQGYGGFSAKKAELGSSPQKMLLAAAEKTNQDTVIEEGTKNTHGSEEQKSPRKAKDKVGSFPPADSAATLSALAKSKPVQESLERQRMLSHSIKEVNDLSIFLPADCQELWTNNVCKSLFTLATWASLMSKLTPSDVKASDVGQVMDITTDIRLGCNEILRAYDAAEDCSIDHLESLRRHFNAIGTEVDQMHNFITNRISHLLTQAVINS